MSAPPMPAARQGGGGAAAGVRQSESSRGADLVAKVRQKLVDDQLLEELGEEPFTMEDGTTGPGFEDLCECLPGQLSCSAEDLKVALETVRKAVVNGSAEPPKPIATRRVKSAILDPSSEPSKSITSSEPRMGAKPMRPMKSTPEVRSKPTKPAVTTPVKPSPVPAIVEPSPVAESNGVGDTDVRPAAPKPRVSKSVSTSVLATDTTTSASPAKSGGPGKPVRHKPTLPPSVSSSDLPSASSVESKMNGSTAEETETTDDFYEDMSAGGKVPVVPRPTPTPSKPKATRPVTGIDFTKEGPARKGGAPPKPSRPVSAAPRVSPIDAGFAEMLAAKSAAAGEKSATPTKPTRRSTGVPGAESSAGPAAMPRKPVRERAKTASLGGAPATGTAGADGNLKKPAPLIENSVVEETDSLYAEITSPTKKSETESKDSSPVQVHQAADADKDKVADEALDKAEGKAGKKSLTSRFGHKLGKFKKQTTTEHEVTIEEDSAPVLSPPADPVPAPAAAPAKPPPKGGWSARDINLTGEQLIQIMELVKLGKCTQEEAIERMQQENRQKAAAAAAAAEEEDSALAGGAEEHEDECAGDDLYETPGPASATSPPKPAALPRSAPAPPPATVVPITPEPLVDGGDDHADGPPKDLDKQAKTATLKGKLKGLRKKKDSTDDHGEDVDADGTVGKKKKAKFGGIFSKKTPEKEAIKEDSPPSSPAPHSEPPAVEVADAGPEESDMYATVGPSPVLSPSPTPAGAMTETCPTSNDDAQADKETHDESYDYIASSTADEEDDDEMTNACGHNTTPQPTPADGLSDFDVVTHGDVPSERDAYAQGPFIVGSLHGRKKKKAKSLNTKPKTPKPAARGLTQSSNEHQYRPKFVPRVSYTGMKRGSKTMFSGLKSHFPKPRSGSKVVPDEDSRGNSPDAVSPMKLSQPSAMPSVSYSSVKEEEPDKPAYDGPFVAEAIVEMPYKPSPYDTESLALEVDDVVKVIEMAENGSWTGLLRGKVGKFKFIYVRVLGEEQEEDAQVEVRAVSPVRPSPVTPSVPTTLDEMFNQLNLTEYIETFKENGYDDLSFFKDIDTAQALVEIGVTDSAHQEAILFMVDVLNAENKKRSGSLSKRSHRMSRSGISKESLFSSKPPAKPSRPLSMVQHDAPTPGVVPHARQRAATSAVPTKPTRNAAPKVMPPIGVKKENAKDDAALTRSTSPEAAKPEAGKEPDTPKKAKPLSSAFAAQLESSLKANQGADKDASTGVKRRSTVSAKSTSASAIDSRSIAVKAAAKRKSFEDGDVRESPQEATAEAASDGKIDTKKRRAPAPPPSEAKSAAPSQDNEATKANGTDQPSTKPRSASRSSLVKPETISEDTANDTDSKAVQAPARTAPPPRPTAPANAKSADGTQPGPAKSTRSAPPKPAGSSQPGTGPGEKDAGELEAAAKQLETLRKKLDADGIKLSAAPYSVRNGSSGIPPGLVQRIAMDTRIAIVVICPAIEKLRQESLTAAKRTMVASEPVSTTSAEEWLKYMTTTCLYEWLQSIGLPMYNAPIAELGYDISTVAQLTEEEMREAGISNVLHAKRILRAASSLSA